MEVRRVRRGQPRQRSSRSPAKRLARRRRVRCAATAMAEAMAAAMARRLRHCPELSSRARACSATNARHRAMGTAARVGSCRRRRRWMRSQGSPQQAGSPRQGRCRGGATAAVVVSRAVEGSVRGRPARWRRRSVAVRPRATRRGAALHGVRARPPTPFGPSQRHMRRSSQTLACCPPQPWPAAAAAVAPSPKR